MYNGSHFHSKKLFCRLFLNTPAHLLSRARECSPQNGNHKQHGLVNTLVTSMILCQLVGTLHLFHTRLTSYDNCTSRPMHPSDKQHTHKTHTGISEMCQKTFNKSVLLCHTVRCATACQGVSQLFKSADSAQALRTRSYFHLSPLQSACGTSVC